MKHTAKDIEVFHRNLYLLCGLEDLAPTINDLRTWHDFLLEMKPLEDTEGGPFSLKDLVAVLREMDRQNKQGAKWSMRPITILRDPEKFRDMLLTARSAARTAARAAKRPVPRPAVQTLPTGTTRLTEDAEPQQEATQAWEAAASQLAELRKKAGL